MTLRRKIIKGSLDKIPNIAMGMCLDFQKGPDASNIYVTGSDDGAISRCFRSYTEQYLSQVAAHSYAVTKIKYSPFANDVLLSSSADSTVKIWQVEQKKEKIKECITIRPSNLLGAVNDIAWSPRRSTLFALATYDGRIEFWDLSKSLLDPIISETAKRGTPGSSPVYETTTLLFSHCGGMLVAGDNEGSLKLFQVLDVEHEGKYELYKELNKYSLSN